MFIQAGMGNSWDRLQIWLKWLSEVDGSCQTLSRGLCRYFEHIGATFSINQHLILHCLKSHKKVSWVSGYFLLSILSLALHFYLLFSLWFFLGFLLILWLSFHILFITSTSFVSFFLYISSSFSLFLLYHILEASSSISGFWYFAIFLAACIN